MDYDAFERLVKLRDSGTLTEDEFAEQKSILISEARNTDALSGEKEHIYRQKGPFLYAFIGIAALGITAAAYIFYNGSSSVIAITSPEERLCQSSIRSALINPETVEFFEFQPSDKSTYLSKFEENLNSQIRETVSSSNAGSGLYGVYAQGMASATESIVSRHLSEGVNQERSRLDQIGSRFFTYRVKANGKLGNTITSNQICSVTTDTCDCL